MLSLFAAAVLLPELAPAETSTRPSVVFILADDLGYGDLGCFGSTKIRTPNLDALAARGMKLTRHYAGNAVCAPSRCVLMTGRHPGHVLVRSNKEIAPEGQWPIADETVTIAERFAALGYATGAFGKWGLGGPNTVGDPMRQGFGRFYGYNCQRIAHSFYPVALWSDTDVVPLRNRGMSAYGRVPAGDDPSDPASYERYLDVDYSADLIAEQAVAFVRDNAGQPLFLFHPSTIPHLGLSAPREAIDEYDFGDDDPPYPGGKGYIPAHRPRATYAAMITRLDTHVGQIVAALQEQGRLDSSYIIFSSDNGPAYRGLGGTDTAFFNSNGNLRGRKGDLYEGGVRVPTIIAGPGIEPGSTSNIVSGFEDWTPTLLSLVGQDETLEGLDGVDLSGVLTGATDEEAFTRPPLYREFPSYGGQQAVWAGKWKGYRGDLAKAGRTGQKVEWELYDLDADPNETTNVADANGNVVKRIDRYAASQHTPSDLFPMPALDRPAE